MFENLYEIEDEITESINIKMDDDTINKANCSLLAYNCHVKENESDIIYNPKKDPERAVDILLEYPEDEMQIEIFLETETKEWNSIIHHKNGTGRLSPEQFGQFCSSNFYKKLHKKLLEMWPIKDDLFFQLNDAIENKRYSLDGYECRIIDEDAKEDADIEEIKRHRRKVKLGTPREKNAAGQQIRTNSGRKIINFIDQNIKKGKHEAYYSWPGGNGRLDDEENLKKNVFKWSRWADWEKQKPVARMRFSYSLGMDTDVIGLSISPIENGEDHNRGWISFNLSRIPVLQYQTPIETEDLLKLSIVKRFTKEVIRRISDVLAIPDKEIFEKINKPDKCSMTDIAKTKRIMRNTLNAIKNNQVNTFIYT